MISRVLAWGPEHEGSTRAVGLLRIALALVIFSRYGREVGLFAANDFAHAVLAAYFFILVPMMLVGFYARAATVMVAATLAFMYFFYSLVPGRVGWDYHHTYLLMMAVTLLAFTPCDRSYSLDRYFAVRRAERDGVAPQREFGRLWATRLMALQLSAVYFWTAFDKTDWAFLSGERLEQILVWHYSGRWLEDYVMVPHALVLASIAVVIVEYFLAFAIHVRKLQPIAIPMAIALHGIFYVMLPVETYSITMIVLYLAVVDPAAVHRFMDRMQGHAPVTHRL